MEYYATVNKSNIYTYINEYDVLVCSLKSSRIKAKQLAILEMFYVLSNLGCIFIVNGPLGDVKGLISFFIMKNQEHLLHDTLKMVGYCDKFYKLDFSHDSNKSPSDIMSINELMWKSVPFSVHTFFVSDKKVYDNHSSHNREFLIYSSDGSIKKVVGYRGDGSVTGRRALPVEDSRLMINLADIYSTDVLLDPFAGSGGILYEARYIKSTLELLSVDIDPVLEPGLKHYADCHYTMDACDVDINKEIDAIVTEVPFAPDVTNKVADALRHVFSYLKSDGRLVFMCAIEQYNLLSQIVGSNGFYPFIEKQINRKGTDVVISAWNKSKKYINSLKEFCNVVQKVY